MIKKEKREVFVKYCDYCGLEIDDYSSTSKHYKDGSEKHFHSMYIDGKKTCLSLFEEQERKGV
jgi:hypothetical protein